MKVRVELELHEDGDRQYGDWAFDLSESIKQSLNGNGYNVLIQSIAEVKELMY